MIIRITKYIMMYYYNNDLFFPFHFVGTFVMILFWILIIALIVRVLRRHPRDWNMMGMNKTPIDILKERYAKGEISKEQFEQMKKDLA